MDDKMDDFCLKVLHPNYGDKERFNREVDLLSELPSHKNLTTLVLANTALVQGSRISFFCESMIFGKELQLPRLFSDKWTEAQCAEFFAQVCDGVEILSAKDIVHRDLKPANIIVKEDGTPVIVDLGIARGLNYSTLTDEYQPGTLAYMSPEQLKGDRNAISVATDLYCIGLMMFEALTGQHPFYASGVDSKELIARSQRPRDTLDSPCFSHVSSAMRIIVADLLAVEPKERLSSPKEVAARLRAIASPEKDNPTKASINASDAWFVAYCLGGLLAVFASAAHESVLQPITVDSIQLERYKGRNMELFARLPGANNPAEAANAVAEFTTGCISFWQRYNEAGGNALLLGEVMPVCLIGYFSSRSPGIEVLGNSIDWVNPETRAAAVQAGAAFEGSQGKAPTFREAFKLLAPVLLQDGIWSGDVIFNLFLKLYIPEDILAKLSIKELDLSVGKDGLLAVTTGAVMESMSKVAQQKD